MKIRAAMTIIVLLLSGTSFALEEKKIESDTLFNRVNVGGLLRGYYFNDHRLINGREATFASEGVVNITASEGCWLDAKLCASAAGEFFLNQPFSKTIKDNTVKSVYTTVYDPDPFEVSELYLKLNSDDFSIKFGKAATPFGRYYFPLFSNARFDAPFIRTESILWKETGLFLLYTPGAFSFDLALTNGERWAFGISGKKQDGRGSDSEKVFNNHAGIDFMVRGQRVVFSLEAIYDEYGCHWVGCEKLPAGRKSLYYRDIFYGTDTPITGIGGYADLLYEGERWVLDLNYGLFEPRKIGNIYHDDPIYRWLIKTAYRVSRSTRVFLAGFVENERTTNPQQRRTRDPHDNYTFSTGFQYGF